MQLYVKIIAFLCKSLSKNTLLLQKILRNKAYPIIAIIYHFYTEFQPELL